MRKTSAISILLIVLAIFAVAPAMAAIVFSDDFSGDLSQWTVASGKSSFWTIENEELSSGGWGRVQIVAGDATWSSYEVKAKVKALSTAPFAGILFRFVDSSNWMWVGMYTLSDFQIQIMENGVLIVDTSITSSYGFELDTFYEFKVVANGNNFEFYVNGVLQGERVDSTFPQGKIGLYTAWQTHAHFDDVIVDNPGNPFNAVPEPGPLIISVLFVAALATYGLIRKRTGNKAIIKPTI